MGAIATDPNAQLLKELLRAMREPVVLTDRFGKIVCASASARSLLGAPARIEGRLLVGFVELDERRAFRTLLDDPDRPAIAVRVVPRLGAPVAVLLEAAPAGEWIFWSLEEARAEQAALHPAFERLVDGLAEGVLAVDRQLQITLANPAAARIGGFRSGEQLPTRWGDFDLESFAAALFDPAAMHAEALLRPVDGILLTLTGMPARGRTRALLLITDAGDRERREQQEREFIANAAHELQTPLTAIVGALDVLEAGAAEDPAERARFLQHLRRESERLVRLVQSLLLLARATSPPGVRVSAIPVRPLLEGIAAGLRPRDGVRVDVLARPELHVTGNPELVERAVSNLAENAVKHTRAGSILLSARSGRRGIVLEVSDTGSGMSAEERERATDRFYRGGNRGADGFGLGLAIVRQIAHALDGTLELESGAGKGTVARLILPRRPS